jgi:hypothetical protein
MPARKILTCISLIALAIAAQPAFAQNGDNAPATSSGGATNPSATPAQRTHKQHSGRHRRQQQQQPAPQTGATSN